MQLKKHLRLFVFTLIFVTCVVFYLIGGKHIIKCSGMQGQWLERNERQFALHYHEFETIMLPQGTPINGLKIRIRATTPIIGGLISARDLDAIKNDYDNIRFVRFSCYDENLLDATIVCPIEKQDDVAAFLIVRNERYFPPDPNDIFVSYSWLCLAKK